MGKVSMWYQLFGGGYRVFIIEVIVGGSFFVYVEPFCGVKVWAFLVELYNVRDV